MEMALIAGGIAATALQTLGTIRQGQAEKAQADFRARQLDFQASQELAAEQHDVVEKRRQNQILQSRALAAAGASGGGALDSNVLKAITGIAEEGERDVQTGLFNASSEADKARQAASVSRFEGKLAKRSSRLAAGVTAFSGLSKAAMQGRNAFGQPSR